jgi:hypothetical protein
MGCGVWPDRRRGWRAASDWGSGLARSWTQTDTRACGGGELCLVVVALQSAEGFGVQHVEVLETGGEPALAEWLGGDMFMGTAGTSGTAYDGGTYYIPFHNKNVYMLADVSSGSVLEV